MITIKLSEKSGDVFFCGDFRILDKNPIAPLQKSNL